MKRIFFSIFLALCLHIPLVALAQTSVVCGYGNAPCGVAPIQGIVLFNSQTTGAAVTPVVVTIPALQGTRAHVYHVEARCNTAAATSGITITDGGVAIWSTVGNEVLAANNFVRDWSTGLSGATASQVVITLAACTAGTGTLSVQADRY